MKDTTNLIKLPHPQETYISLVREYNPMTDFVCYPRDKYGDDRTICYANLHTPDHVCDCHEDRKLTGKSLDGCTPSSITIKRRG